MFSFSFLNHTVFKIFLFLTTLRSETEIAKKEKQKQMRNTTAVNREEDVARQTQKEIGIEVMIYEIQTYVQIKNIVSTLQKINAII